MSEDRTPAAERPPRRRWALSSSRFLVGGVLAAAFVMRLRLLEVPLERDEGVYAYLGRLILQGVPLYTSSVDLQMPGLWLLYAAAMAAFGQTAAGIHLALLVVNLISVWLVFLLGRRLCGESLGVVAAAGFASLSLSQRMLGFTANAEHFVLVFALAGMVTLLRAVNSGRTRDVVLSGVLSGLSLVVKQPGVFFIGFAGLYLAYALARESRASLRSRLAKLALFAAGASAPFGLLCLWFAARGVIDEFFFWAFRYSWAYMDQDWSLAVSGLRQRALPILLHTTVFCALALVGALRGAPTPEGEGRDPSRTVFLLGFAAFSAMSVFPGWRFRPHYFLLLTPAVALLAAAGVGAISRGLPGLRGRWVGATAAGLTLLAVGQVALAERDFWFRYSPEEIIRHTYFHNPFVESQEIGRFLQRNTRPDEPIAILGSEPQIYLYAQRDSASNLIVMYPMMWAPRELALRLQQQTIREIEAAAPRYVVVVTIPYSWGQTKASEGLIFRWLDDFTRRLYRLVGVVDIDYPRDSISVWGEGAQRYTPRNPLSQVMVLERRDSPEARDAER